MFSKSNLIGTVVAFLLLFFLGWLFYGLVAAEFFKRHTIMDISKNPEEMGFIVASCLIQAFALSNIYGRWSRGSHSLQKGFEFGAWVGIFLGFGVGLMWYGTSNVMDITGTLTECLWSIVYYGIAGLGIALVFKKFHKPAAAN